MAIGLCFALVMWKLLMAQAQDVCRPDVLVANGSGGVVCAGRPFSLECFFECVPMSYRIQLWHGDVLLRNESVTAPNSSLRHHVAQASARHNGTYRCQTQPTKALGQGIDIVINGSCEESVEADGVAEAEAVKSASPYLLAVWYLLCKAGAFLLLITITLLPHCCAH